jgi:predicted nucleic acid-binding protein
VSAVVNASPLIALALANRLDILERIFGRVVVPASVYREVVGQGTERPGASVIAQATWLHIVSPTVTPTIEPTLLGLDSGELDVLLLAQELKPDWVVIDERQARRVARLMGFPVKGTLGILLTAGLAGLLSQEEALQAMYDMIRHGIRISPVLQNWLKEELERM